MRVVGFQVMADCLDLVTTREIVFSGPITRDWIFALEQLGRLEYYSHFPKPFFRLTRPGDYIIKGVLGRDRCQVVFLGQLDTLQNDLINQLDLLTPDSSCRPDQEVGP